MTEQHALPPAPKQRPAVFIGDHGVALTATIVEGRLMLVIRQPGEEPKEIVLDDANARRLAAYSIARLEHHKWDGALVSQILQAPDGPVTCSAREGERRLCCQELSMVYVPLYSDE